jgi:hypothetical protein
MYREGRDGENRFLWYFNSFIADTCCTELNNVKQMFGRRFLYRKENVCSHSCIEKETLFVCINEAKGNLRSRYIYY